MASKARQFQWILALISCFVLLQAATPRNQEYDTHESAHNSLESLTRSNMRVRKLSTGGGRSAGGGGSSGGDVGSGAGGSSSVPKQAGATVQRRRNAAAGGHCHVASRLVTCAVGVGVAFLAST